MRSLTSQLFFIGFFLVACTSEPATSIEPDTPSTNDVANDIQGIDAVSDAVADDTPNKDAETPIDALLDTQVPSDSNNDAKDKGTTSWGSITGACGSIHIAIKETSASVLQTTYTFNDTEKFDAESLTGKPKKRYDEPNAGGSSKCTEVMSMQLLIDCEQATITKLETEITYDTEGKIADYLIDIDGIKTGVSVTRAYKGPMIDVYTMEDATSLLEKKLAGIAEARQNVSTQDAWSKSLVHIWTLHAEWADTVTEAWNNLDDVTKGTTLVLVTVEEGSSYIVTDNCDD